MVGVISSVLLLVAPNANLFERSKKYFGLWMKWVGHEVGHILYVISYIRTFHF